MKKSFMTRALAMGLSMAMAFSLSAATNVSVASAAAKPAMKSTKMTLKVGQSKNYQATAATQKAYKISGVKLSTAGKTKVDVKVNSSKKSIKVTGKAVTKSTNVVITFKNNSTKKSTKVTTKAVVKANVPTLTSVKQEAGTKLTATLAAPVEKVDLADIALVHDESHAVIAVKSVTIDTADATKLNIETYVDMTDGKSYTLTYTAQDEAKTQSTATFTATDGKIASFALSTATIPANKATTIKYSALDANGIVIYEKAVNDKAEGIDIDVASDNGYLDDDGKLTLLEVGNTAKVTVSYHTYNYDAQGNETGLIKNEFTVTAVDSSVAVSEVKYTLVDDETTVPAWENVTVNTRLAMGDNKWARFQIKDSNGDDITNDCEYTVESSNDNIVIASGEAKGAVSLVPVKEGSAYLVLKDNNKTVTTLAITVVRERTLATFTLDKTSVAIATDAADGTAGTVSIGFSAKDQYGDDITVDIANPEPRSNATAATNVHPVLSTNSGSKGAINIHTTGAAAGTYTYNVVASKGEVSRTRTFTVNVRTVSGTPTYLLQFVKGENAVSGAAATQTLNTTVTKDSDAASVISVNLVKRSNNVISGSANGVTLKSIIVRGSNGTRYADTTVTNTVSSAAVTKAAIENFKDTTTDSAGHVVNITAVSLAGDTFTKNLPAGSYTVTLKFNDGSKDDKTVTGTFKVEDKQPALTASVLKTNAGSENNIYTVLGDKNFVKYVYGGVTQGTDSTPVEITKVYGNRNGRSCVVNRATVKVKVADNVFVNINVSINRVFTTTSGEWVGDIEKP